MSNNPNENDLEYITKKILELKDERGIYLKDLKGIETLIKCKLIYPMEIVVAKSMQRDIIEKLKDVKYVLKDLEDKEDFLKALEIYDVVKKKIANKLKDLETQEEIK